MRKKLKRLCVLVIAPLLFCIGCNQPQTEGFVMKAKITAINSRIEVEIISDQYNSGVMWVNLPDNLTIVNEHGEKISVSDLAVDDQIEICYNGQVMMSYPAQIVAKKITLLK